MQSPKVKACVLKELKEVKDKSLIDQIYPIQGVSQKEQEQEKEKEKTTAEEKGTPSAPAATIIFPENEKDEYDYNCRSIIDQSIMLFDRLWNQPNKTSEEYRLVSEYITAYGFREVEFAFREAVKYNSKKLAYVEAICKKRKEKIAIEKSKEEARQKKLEQDKLLSSQREAWSKLNLVEMTFGKKFETSG
jgi:hypothetical protein